MPDEEIGCEKRIAPRRQVFGQAVILGPGLRANCVIRDLSATGAKIGVSRTVKLPEQFEVVLLKTKSVRRVTLRWRRGDFAGIQFCQGETAPLIEPERTSAPQAAPLLSGIKSSWRGRQ
jgi:hypothetical protein